MTVLNPEANARIEKLQNEIERIKLESMPICERYGIAVERLECVLRDLSKNGHSVDEPLSILAEYAPESHRDLLERGVKKGLDGFLCSLFEELFENLR